MTVEASTDTSKPSRTVGTQRRWDSGTPREERRTAFYRERQIRHLYEHAAGGLISNFLLTLLLLSLIHDYLETVSLIAWLVAAFSVLGLRTLLHFRFNRRLSGEPLERRWLELYAVGAIASGAVWGIASLMFAPALPPIDLVIMILVLGGLSAGAATLLSVVFSIT